ncbi:hypothetical protein MMYC01_206301 [Madurella mycetomatis]|uniref:Meiotically up-regulated gene 151 protein n=1 Tax=Madurella mycetomatis TaxID=100816 RepID=A0A175VY78_9PEZI|nr:hypothetical protein MMYC01_206301 [Madurella mycetomatis]
MGLVQYDSSDEDEGSPTQTHPPEPEPSAKALPSNIKSDFQPHPTTTATAEPPLPPQPPAPEPGPLLGPALGPSRPPPEASQTAAVAAAAEEVDLSFLDADRPPNPSQPAEPPRSPYTTTRTLLRDLTLPSVANMDIPPSPPGSPPPGHDALTAKFDSFLRLKRTKGVHFNERLASSAGLRNPALMDKLLAFSGVETGFGDDDDDGGGGGGGGGGGSGGGAAAADNDDGGGGDDGRSQMGRKGGARRATEQYATVLSGEVWDPHCFPSWGFKGALKKAQERVRRERERGKGEAVEFVSATSVTAASSAGSGTPAEVGGGSRAGTPAGGGAGGSKRKGRFDV